ncbi:uncharacterized protein G2W53_037310 [Senna tora]|uniref:Retrotransposon Copia-like N-terminal domain-containing protein n=1 Tax=Senna tora TaxID=362788 RepID=A0A834SVS6_9FABA|nr:uncharacterized protein G2W53_037310 [Senna tora]
MALSPDGSSSSATSATTTKTTFSLFNNSSSSTTLKVDKQNYILWAAAITPLLRGHELESHVDGIGVAPPKLIGDGKE